MYYDIDTLNSEKWDHFYNDIRNGAVIILFYMNGCPYCESMKDQWNLFISKIRTPSHKIPVYRILKDVQEKVPDEILKHISGYPTILSVKHNQLGKIYPEYLQRNVNDFMKFYYETEKQMKIRENIKPSKRGGKKIKKTKKKKIRKHKKRTHKKKKKINKKR